MKNTLATVMYVAIGKPLTASYIAYSISGYSYHVVQHMQTFSNSSVVPFSLQMYATCN